MRTLPPVATRPVFGRHGKKVVGGLCGWELVALIPGAPIPTLTAIVKKVHPVGFIILGLLAHHWYVEADWPKVAITLGP